MKTHGFFWAIIVGLLLVARVTWAQEPNEPNEITIDPHWSMEAGAGLGADGDSLFLFSAMYWNDYVKDGGVGIVGIGDDTIAGKQSIIIGPGAEFPTGPVYLAIANQIFPDAWAAAFGNLETYARPYGRVALLFDEDFQVTPLVGTGIRLFPNSSIQPTIRTDWISPQGRAKGFLNEGWLTSLNVAWFF
ncbi:MAG TPA: hypothetical protein VMY37_04010 [Thermoguttaceae bacterium]|nr:hypothetical protein [Thermoguttaceae bacterium]